MKIKIKKLGLAAFIKTISENDPLTNFENYTEEGFIFESNKDKNEWKIEFMNHFVSRFDKNLMEMRDFIKR